MTKQVGRKIRQKRSIAFWQAHNEGVTLKTVSKVLLLNSCLFTSRMGHGAILSVGKGKRSGSRKWWEDFDPVGLEVGGGADDSVLLAICQTKAII